MLIMRKRFYKATISRASYFNSSSLQRQDQIRQTGVIADVLGAVAKINSVAAPATSGLGCPQLSKYDYDTSQLSKYPGYKS